MSWRRNKVIALLIAILFGPWTWVYTYSKNPGKAAIGLGSNVTLLTFWVMQTISMRTAPKDVPSFYPGEAVVYTGVPTFAVLFATWLMAIIDTSMAKEWQINEPQNREKMPALILAMFMGPWTWIYTHRVDYWKFWPSMMVGIGAFIADNRVSNPISHAIVVIGSLGIWIASIVIAAKRSDEWYKTYSVR